MSAALPSPAAVQRQTRRRKEKSHEVPNKTLIFLRKKKTKFPSKFPLKSRGEKLGIFEYLTPTRETLLAEH